VERLVTEETPLSAEVEARVDILIVDDNSKNLMALEAMLGGLGQNIVRAESGAEALRCLLHQDFALALLDIQMPELDGFQTAELIRARDRSRHMPIIFLTAFSKDAEQVAQAYQLGAVDFLFKPIVPFILRAKVQAFVELHRKTVEIDRQGRLLREVERREHERRLEEAARKWESDRLREEMIQERKVKETLARTVAERERAQEALKASNQRLRLLSDMANRLLVTDQPEGFLDSLYEQLARHLHLEVYLNYLIAPDGMTLRLAAFSGVPGGAETELAATGGEPVSRSVVHTRKRVVAEHVQGSSDASLAVARALGLDAYAVFPLCAQDRVLGTLSFGTRQRPAFAEDDIAMMQVVSDEVAVALERARLIAELSSRNSALAHADQRKDEFLAMLAHELRNPMAPIVNAVQLIRLPGTDPHVTERALGVLERQVKHMVRLVDDLLDLSRITTGKIELRREPVSLASIVDHAVQTSAPLMETFSHAFTVTMPPEELRLFADRTRLSQVLSNLLNNAAKYSPKNSKIDLSCAREGMNVILRVRDQGIGISTDMLDEVFGLFVQSDRTADRSQGGLGIGLTLVKSLVEMHGGTVKAESEGVGHGSEFVVSLPILEDDGAVTAVSIPVPRPPSQARRVIVVEDNEDIRDTMRDLFEFHGHSATVFEDGPAAVEAVLLHRPDVAFIDIGLPGLDGYQVVAALRSRAPDLTTRLIAVTGYGRPEDRARALAAGFHDHLVKPVTSDALLRFLENV
jgi:signal transduction histidine kinase/CheY-like chemotaxis protein